MKADLYSIDRLDAATSIVREYADEADKITKGVISKDREAVRIIAIVESFLRDKKRIIYGGAAINALMPKELKFYNPEFDLPDYDFLTPDGLEDCAQLVERYKIAGFKEVDVRLGIHEGTYKVFVNYRAAADVTELPAELFNRLHKKTRRKEGLYCAPPDWLRMSAYLELSRPAGDVSRWEKVFRRLQLINKIYPLSTGTTDCKKEDSVSRFPPAKRKKLHGIILQAVMDTRTFFAGAMLEGIYKALRERTLETEEILGKELVKYDPRYILVTETFDETTSSIAAEIKAQFPTVPVEILEFPEFGEVLPKRNEILFGGKRLATIFPTVACHAFLTMSLKLPTDNNVYLVRVASIDTAITLLYGMWFTGLQKTVGRRILCVLQALVDIEAHMRLENPRESKISLFPLTCLGHQPSLPELKKQHKIRVESKKKEIRIYLEKTLQRLLKNERNTRKVKDSDNK